MGSAIAIAKDANLALLEVVGGVHRGVTTPIGDRPLRIGAGGGSDIILADPGVADDHAILRFERGAVVIEARGDEIKLGNHAIPRGQGCRARLPVEISIGGCAIRLNRPDGKSGWIHTPNWLHTRGALVGLVAFAAVLVAATQADAIKAVATDAPQTAAQPAAAPAMDLAARTPTADPVQALRQRVAEANIEGLRIERDGDRIMARGLVDEAGRKRWATTQKWFDQSYSGRFVLASEVGLKSAATMPRFQVQAIWFGASPYVVTADGQRRQAGATLGDGWVIRDIRDGRLTVSKAGEDVTLTF